MAVTHQLAQLSLPVEEPRANRVLGRAHDLGRLGSRAFLDGAQDERDALVDGQLVERAAEGQRQSPPFQLLVGCAVGRALRLLRQAQLRAPAPGGRSNNGARRVGPYSAASLASRGGLSAAGISIR